MNNQETHNDIFRDQFIQKLIDKINGQSYLEIGIGDGEVFESIICPKKVSVDPCISDGSEKLSPTFKLSSDDFFAQNKDTFDIIFIDGMHKAEYVERDIKNSISCLNEGGYIICHDINPLTKESQIVPRAQEYWHGDAWKAWVSARQTNPNITMCVIDASTIKVAPEDCGLGVIQKGSQKLLDVKDLDITYENLEKHRKEWLNLISIEEFSNHAQISL